MEFYCTDLDCDCRNVFIHVQDLKTRTSFATISYGWESIEFYKKWIHEEKDEDFILKNFKGPSLAAMQTQSRFADKWLELFKDKKNRSATVTGINGF